MALSLGQPGFGVDAVLQPPRRCGRLPSSHNSIANQALLVRMSEQFHSKPQVLLIGTVFSRISTVGSGSPSCQF
jgi:hypothetical protein